MRWNAIPRIGAKSYNDWRRREGVQEIGKRDWAVARHNSQTALRFRGWAENSGISCQTERGCGANLRHGSVRGFFVRVRRPWAMFPRREGLGKTLSETLKVQVASENASEGCEGQRDWQADSRTSEGQPGFHGHQRRWFRSNRNENCECKSLMRHLRCVGLTVVKFQFVSLVKL